MQRKSSDTKLTSASTLYVQREWICVPDSVTLDKESPVAIMKYPDGYQKEILLCENTNDRYYLPVVPDDKDIIYGNDQFYILGSSNNKIQVYPLDYALGFTKLVDDNGQPVTIPESVMVYPEKRGYLLVGHQLFKNVLSWNEFQEDQQQLLRQQQQQYQRGRQQLALKRYNRIQNRNKFTVEQWAQEKEAWLDSETTNEDLVDLLAVALKRGKSAELINKILRDLPRLEKAIEFCKKENVLKSILNSTIAISAPKLLRKITDLLHLNIIEAAYNQGEKTKLHKKYNYILLEAISKKQKRPGSELENPNSKRRRIEPVASSEQNNSSSTEVSANENSPNNTPESFSFSTDGTISTSMFGQFSSPPSLASPAINSNTNVSNLASPSLLREATTTENSNEIDEFSLGSSLPDFYFVEDQEIPFFTF